MNSIGSPQQQWAGFALPDANAFTGRDAAFNTRNTAAKTESELAFAVPENNRSDSSSADEKPDRPHEFNLFGEDGLTFGDVIDVINPLQHIPIIGTLYREMTDDTLSAGPRMLGGTLFFGPLGLASAVANVAVEESTGKDIGDHIVAFARSEEDLNPAMAIGFAANQNEAASTPATTEAMAPDPVSTWAQNEVAWAHRQSANKPPIEKQAPDQLPDAAPFLREQERWAMKTQQVAVLDADIRAAAQAYQAAAGLYQTPGSGINASSGRG